MSTDGSSAIASYLPSTLLARLTSSSVPAIQTELAAVLSIDIAGFTQISDLLEKEHAVGVDQLSLVLNEFFGELISVVEQHGGELVSIQGDGTLAAWVAPEGKLPDAVEQAARCGLALSRKLDKHRGVRGSPLRVRIGLGCGPLLLTRLGDESRWTLSVAGQAAIDAVAAEHVAGLGTLTISAAAWAHLPLKRRGRTLSAGSVELLSIPPGPAPHGPLGPAELAGQDLLRYLPWSVRARVTSDVPLWQAEVRYITAAFLQLRNADGSNIQPEQAQDSLLIVQTELARCGGGVDEISFHDKGTVVTTVFGLPPAAYEDDARRTVAAALAIRTRAMAIGVDVSVGIGSGLVFWGPIGRESRRRFALLGSSMNLACRLMQHARGEVLCCPSTMEALAGRVSGEEAGVHRLKGFDLPVSIFRAHSVGAPRPPNGELFGRTAETALITARVEQGRAGQGSTLWVEAPPGLGKSALVCELQARGRAANLPVLIAHGDAVEQTTPYHAWGGPIAELLGIDSNATLAERMAQTIAKVDTIAEGVGLAPLLAPILRLPLVDSDKTRLLDGMARADRTADLIIMLLRQASVAGLVLALEDLHWFDSASLRLALLTRKRLPSVPLVVTTRPAVQDADEGFLALQAGAQRLNLAPLAQADIVALVADRLGAESVSREAHAFLCERAGGNPLFAASLARELGSAGVLTVTDGVVYIGSEALGAPERVPRSLDAIIGTRVDRLSPAAALTLKVASVVGRSFTLDMLLAIHPTAPSESSLLESLQALEDERLLIVTQAGVSYTFDHAVTHDVSYARIPKRQREFLHASIANWCEKVFVEDAQSNYPLLAYHREQGGNAVRACDFLELAAQQALRSGAFREATRFLERAVALARSTRADTLTAIRRAKWNRQLSEAYDLLGDKVRMGDCARAALRELGRPEPVSAGGRILFALRGCFWQAVPRKLRTRWRRPEMGEREFELSRAYQSLSAHYFYSLSPIGMVGNTLQATNAADRGSSHSERAKCYSGMALWLGIVGLWRLGRSYARRAVAECEVPDDPAVTTQALGVASLFYVGMADFEGTLRCCAAAQALAAPRDDHAWWSIAQAIRLWSHLYRGEHSLMPKLVVELRERARRADSDLLQAWATRFEASFLLASGSSEASCRLFGEVLPVVQRHGDRAEMLLVNSSLVLALARANEFGSARARLGETMSLLAQMERATSHILLQGMADLLDGIQLLLANTPEDHFLLSCRSRGLRALRGYAKSFPIGLPRYHHFLGLSELRRNQLRRAGRTFQHGLRIAVELGLPEDGSLLRADLEHLRRAMDGDRDALSRAIR